MDKREEVYQYVIERIVGWRDTKWWKENVTKEKLSNSTELDDIGLDSLDVLEIIVKTEEHFDCEVKDDTIENILTIGNMVDLIVKSPQK
jgi:acyl carrier protein